MFMKAPKVFIVSNARETRTKKARERETRKNLLYRRIIRTSTSFSRRKIKQT